MGMRIEHRWWVPLVGGVVAIQLFVVAPGLDAKTTKKKPVVKKTTPTKPTTTIKAVAATSAPTATGGATTSSAATTVAGSGSAPTSAPVSATTTAATLPSTPAGLYAAFCAICHGASAEGGNPGPPLAKGELAKTFPKIEDAMAWARSGAPAIGTPYGDPARAGGQHVVNLGQMPAFAAARLPDEQLRQIIEYIRGL